VATVKRIVRDGVTLIVTKKVDGETRVSCECCQEDLPDTCCMYPASGLGVLYDEEDLPLELTINPYDLNSGVSAISVNVERDGLIYGPHDFGGTYQQRLILSQTNSLWEFQFTLASSPWETLDINNCLFEQESAEETIFDGAGGVTDRFADSYTAECTTTVNGQTTITTRTYVREALCIWRSRNQDGDITGQLYYRNDATPAEAEQIGRGRVLWRLDGAGYRSDEGPYTSPEGTYGENPECVVTADS